MGRKLDIFLGRISRENAKLKSLLAITTSRVIVLKGRRGVRCSNTRDDVAHLLHLSHHERALLRVEHVIKEQNMIDVYSMIESYCYVICERCALLEKTKECPEELREAVAGLIFATSRCGDLPELQDVRRIFASKFGKEFVEAATQLRNGCGVDPKLIQKLSTRLPSLETRRRALQEIAAEKGIKLDLNHETSPVTAAAATISMVDQRLPEECLDEAFLKKEMGKYKDVSAAAQAAFQSAVSAAAAAKQAMELSKSDFRGNGTGNLKAESSKQLDGSNNSTQDNLSLNSDSDLEGEAEIVQKNVYVEKEPEAREKPKSVRTRKSNV